VLTVVITGSRGWRDNALIRDRADALPPRSRVVVGGAPGADRAFEGAARIRGHEVIVMRADWSKGKGAGFRRNEAMLDRLDGLSDDERLVIAFWLGFSPGTRHTIREAMKRGIPLDLHWRPE
jgi:hypothetical protein